MKNSMLELKNVTRSLGKWNLGPIDISFLQRQITVLIGPSGCGKSTLLRLMTGLLWPDSGMVTFVSKPITLKTVQSVRLKMGYVIQDGGLFPHLKAGENVSIMARYLGWDKMRINQRLNELLDLVKLNPDFMGRYPAELSGGQRQRVSLMRALMLDPEILLLDEPLGALDPMIRSDLQHELLRIFHDLKKTVIMVTHDLSEAAFFADTIVLIADGKIVLSGTYGDLLENHQDSFVSRFINAQRQPVETLTRSTV
jgi:osmoprotectant transport system ATP-binding protein